MENVKKAIAGALLKQLFTDGHISETTYFQSMNVLNAKTELPDFFEHAVPLRETQISS